MAVKIRKAFVVMPDSLNDDQRYIFPWYRPCRSLRDLPRICRGTLR